MPEIQYNMFVINETPYCFWDLDIRKRNVDFLNSIDPGYFDHIANIHGQMLTGDERQYAAIALRTAYAHALESFFALLGATAQSPDCIVGWLLKYRNEELFDLIRKIDKGSPILAKLNVRPITWETLASKINAISSGDEQKDLHIRECFADLWSRFAMDFLDEKLTHEYNSVKHGLRIRKGGFYFAIGPEDTPGVPAPPEKMRVLGTSEFGSAFLIPERMHNRFNIRVMEQRLNWNPENLIHALRLLSMSIGNVLAYLKWISGVPESELQMFVQRTNRILKSLGKLPQA